MNAPPTIPHPTFGAMNYAVLAAYFLLMLVIGIRAGRQTKGAASYFVAERRAHHVLVGLSLLGTYLSALTMMSLPAMSYGEANWTWTIQIPFLLVTAIVITRFVLPRYREEGCISVYEFLERRIHVSSRLIAAVAFILLSIGRMGLVLYLPALAFHIVTGAPLLPTIVVLGIVVTAYTVLGGIRGVILTDAIQVVIFIIGALATVFYFFTPGVDFFAVANAHDKFRVLERGTDITRVVSLWLVLETLVQTIRIYGAQQDMTQRYMAAESTRRANQSVWLCILGYIPLGYLFYFIGTGLFVFYQTHPDPAVAALEAGNRLDSLYAYFVVTQLPQGLAGLVIAAFFAAAMSTISSSMNSSSAVCMEDFYKRFLARERTDEHYLRIAKGLSLLWGVLAIVMAILFTSIAYAQVTWIKVMGISTCGILGLMGLAFLRRRVRPWAAVLGWAVSYLTLFTMMWFLQIRPHLALVNPLERGGGANFVLWPSVEGGVSFLLWPVVTNPVCFGVALALDRLLPRKR